MLDHRSVAHAREDDYALTPIPEPRPDTGWTTATVDCQHCGDPVHCRVYSVPDTHRLRARWRLLTRLLIIAPIVIFVAGALTFAAHLPDKPASGPAAFLMGFSIPAIAGCVLGAIAARRRAHNDDGVRLTTQFGRHSLQWTSLKFSD